jgi:hypothetical protein
MPPVVVVVVVVVFFFPVRGFSPLIHFCTV